MPFSRVARASPMWLSATGLALVSSFLSSSLSSQGLPSNPVEGVKSLTCTLSLTASGSWSGGEADVKVSPAAPALTFQITDIDSQGGTARLADVTAAVNVVMRAGEGLAHFIDSRPDGTLAVMTVFAARDRGRKMPAAYSRTHYYSYSGPGFISSPEVQESLGHCDVTPG